MSSLAHCLKTHQKLFTQAEIDQITEAAEAYRKEGYKAEVANASAVEDIIRDLEAELVYIDKQVEGQKPKEKPK